MHDLVFCESKSMRNEYAGNTAVLVDAGYDPNRELATIEQVAQFYDVARNTIKTVIDRNRDEFEIDGLKMANAVEMAEMSKKFQIETFEISPRGYLLLTRKCVLRVGMLLTSSPKAKEIRNYPFFPFAGF